MEMQRVFIFRVCLSVCGTGEVHATVHGKSSWLDKNYSVNSAYIGQRRTLDLYPQKFVFNALFQELQTVQFLEIGFLSSKKTSFLHQSGRGYVRHSRAEKEIFSSTFMWIHGIELRSLELAQIPLTFETGFLF